MAEPRFDKQKQKKEQIIIKHRRLQEKIIEEKRLANKQPCNNIYKQAEDEPPYGEAQGEEDDQGGVQRGGGAAAVGEDPAGVGTCHDPLPVQGAKVRDQGENGVGSGLKDSQKKRTKRSAKKRLIGVEPGFVQSTITQFLERFPNLTAGGPSVRLSLDQTTTGGLLKRKSGNIEGPVAKQLKQSKRSLTGPTLGQY